MELSAEARKRAVEAFKAEIMEASGQIRTFLEADCSEWKGSVIKALLHKMRGGASFLGYEALCQDIASLEDRAQFPPEGPKQWFDFIASWEAQIDKFC